MTQELWVAVYAAILGVFTVLLAPVFAAAKGGAGYFRWNASPRDTPFDIGPHAERLKRAFSNFMETFVSFVVIVIALAFAHKSSLISVYGAWIYLAARIVYIPLYVFGVTGIRSLVWGISLAGIVACATVLFF